MDYRDLEEHHAIPLLISVGEKPPDESEPYDSETSRHWIGMVAGVIDWLRRREEDPDMQGGTVVENGYRAGYHLARVNNFGRGEDAA